MKDSAWLTSWNGSHTLNFKVLSFCSTLFWLGTLKLMLTNLLCWCIIHIHDCISQQQSLLKWCLAWLYHIQFLCWFYFSCFLSSVGNHITLVAHSKSVQLALDAAKQLEAEGVDCEVQCTCSNNQFHLQFLNINDINGRSIFYTVQHEKLWCFMMTEISAGN